MNVSQENKMKNPEKFNKKEFLRMTSVSCIGEPHESALAFLKNDDLRSFTDLVNNQDVEAGAGNINHWINKPVDSETGSTLIETAINLGRRRFVECLVSIGARVDLVSQASGFAPPHQAAEQDKIDLLKLFFKDPDACDVNLKAAEFQRSYTPLHVAAEMGSSESLKYLLEFDEVDVDAKDLQGNTTPLLLAIKNKHEVAAKALIENGADLDLKAGRMTLRQFFTQNFPDVDPNNIQVKRRRQVISNLKDKVFKLLKETQLTDEDYLVKLSNFKTYLRSVRSLIDQNALDDVFDIACDKGLHEHVEILLRKGANPNIPSQPLLEAAYYGHHKVLQVLKDYNANFTVTKATKETILHLVLKMQSNTGTRENFQKCLDILLDASNESFHVQMKNLINKKDDRGNTALHYATQMWDQATVRKLLECGANVGIKNYWDEIPISKIRPDTMEQFLSEHCLTSTGDVNHDKFSLTFKYDFLAPNVEALPEKYRLEEKQQDDKESLISKNMITSDTNPRHALPETEPLWYMSQSKEHRHLLKHPVITSFLWYKWQRIRRYFNRNLRFFTLFVYLLTWYIFQYCGNTKTSNLEWYVFFIFLTIAMIFFIIKDWFHDIQSYHKNQSLDSSAMQKENSCLLVTKLILSNWVEAAYICLLVLIIIFGASVLQYILGGLLIIFTLREILQMFVSIKRYFVSFENLMEITIIILVTVLISNRGEDCGELNRHFAAIVIVLSWAELIVLVGRHPKLKEYNIYVTMFLKVLKTFLFFITWYSLFIIAFGLGFYILLHKAEEDVAEDDYVYFNKAWLSIVKTTTMFVGELEFSDIPINLDSYLAPLAYVYFLSFVFLIVVVLMNLLNGLAVSDTGIIREKAEIFSYRYKLQVKISSKFLAISFLFRSQVETISTFESMLLGDPFDFLSNVPQMLSNIPSCSLFRQLYRSNTMRNIFTKIGASEILLFYKFFPDKKVTIYPNQRFDNCSCLR